MSNGKAFSLEARQFASSKLGVPIRDLALVQVIDGQEELVVLQEVSQKRRFLHVAFANNRPVRAAWGKP